MKHAAGLIVLILLAAPLAAAAQGWKPYSYPEAGFLLQFPAEPVIAKGTYRTTTGLAVPSTSWSARVDGVDYSMTMADFSKTEMQEQAALDDAMQALRAAGEVKAEVTERINRHLGHELTLERKDGSRSTLAVFFVDQRLYILDGRALPPDAAGRSNRTSRFQQSLAFPVPGAGGSRQARLRPCSPALSAEPALGEKHPHLIPHRG